MLAACGSLNAAEATQALLDGGAAALRALLRQLDAGTPAGAEGANGRAVMEDLETCLVLFARAEPEAFIDGLVRYPELAKRFAVLSAVGRCPSDRAVPFLMTALHGRSGSMRWLALSALLRRDVAEVKPLLGDLLRDRDGLVVFEATKALLFLGLPAHLPRLISLAAHERTSIGTREAALDAIEKICERAGLPLPEIVTEPRMFELELPVSAELTVSEAMLVRPGEVIAKGPAGDILAPRRAVVVAVAPGHLLLRKRDD